MMCTGFRANKISRTQNLTLGMQMTCEHINLFLAGVILLRHLRAGSESDQHDLTAWMPPARQEFRAKTRNIRIDPSLGTIQLKTVALRHRRFCGFATQLRLSRNAGKNPGPLLDGRLDTGA